MTTQRMRRLLVGGIALGVASVTLGALPALAAGPGYGDVTDAIVYGTSGPVGTVVQDLVDEDDDSTTIPAPFAMNFFGTKYEGLCITTNGTVSPVLTSSDSCTDEYDLDVENLALDSQAPVIAVLALDLDPSEDLYVPGVDVMSVSIAGGTATITTATPHPFSVGDDFFSWFPTDDLAFGGETQGVVTAVPSATTFQFATGQADAVQRTVTGASVSIGDYDDVRDDSNADGYADDGFGAVKQVYEGSTVIDGKQAVVITWYRVPTNDDYNNPQLSNTVQIVLIQEPTANGAADGFDFTVQLNVGTATDNDDGYSAADPSTSCNAEEDISNCRWGMGWANYDPATTTADPYELFADIPIDNLVDGGVNALVDNRLNSTVNGRYTWKMIDGATVGFVVPTMDGSDNGPLTPGSETPVTETPATVSPADASPSAQAPSLAATGSDVVGFGSLGILVLLVGVTLLVSRHRRNA